MPIAMHVVVVGLLLAMFYAVDGTGEWAATLEARQGLLQRAFLLTFYVWVVALALRLLTLEDEFDLG